MHLWRGSCPNTGSQWIPWRLSQVSNANKKLIVIMVFPLRTRVERLASICMDSYEHTRASPKSTFLWLSILYMCSLHIHIQRLENMYTLCSIHLHILYDIGLLPMVQPTWCTQNVVHLLLHSTTAFLYKVSSFYVALSSNSLEWLLLSTSEVSCKVQAIRYK